MRSVFAAEDLADMESIFDDFRKSVRRDIDTPHENKSLTEVDLVPTPDGFEWSVSRREIRPSNSNRPYSVVRRRPMSETADLASLIPEMRIEHLPPFQERVRPSLRRPQTDILAEASNDIVVLSPAAVEVLSASGFDIEALMHDVEDSGNIHTMELDAGIREGIKGTRDKKGEVIVMRREFRRRLAQAYQETLNRSLDDSVSFDLLSTDKLFEMYRQQVEGSGVSEPNFLRESGNHLSALETTWLDIEDAAEATEDLSIEAFVGAIETGGMAMPSSVADAVDAVERVGIGTRGYLKI